MSKSQSNPVPRHVAIIPDGNRRWAKQRRLPAIEGHRRGLERIKEISKAAHQAGVEVLTVWGFSSENWRRGEEEKTNLFKLFNTALNQLESHLIQNQISFHHLGRTDRLPANLLQALRQLEQKTSHLHQGQLNLALDYGGRDEIIRAIQEILHTQGPHQPITEELISQHLDTAGQPDPDLIIRTSGEQRTSGLLPWQAAYSELYFTPLHLPDFSAEQFQVALHDFAQRQRRFGH